MLQAWQDLSSDQALNPLLLLRGVDSRMHGL